MSGFKITSARTNNTDPMFPQADAWQVRITNPRGKTLSTKYYMGFGHNGAKPSIKEVMESLILDAAMVDQPEEEFISELYPDNPKLGMKTYRQCERIANRLEDFLTFEEREKFLEI